MSRSSSIAHLAGDGNGSSVRPPAGEDRPDANRTLGVLFRRAPLIIVCAILAGGAALVFSLLQTTQYTAEASLLFRDAGFDQALSGSQVLQTADPEREAATNISLVSLQEVADRAAADLGGDLTGDEVSNKVQVGSEGRSDVVTISATDPDPEFAAEIANTFANNFIEFRRDADRSTVSSARKLVEADYDALSSEERQTRAGQSLAREISRLQALEALQTGNAELVQEAQPPTSASSPRTARNVVLGGLLGILLGIALAALFHRLDRRLRDPKEFEETFKLPMLATISNSKRLAQSEGGLNDLLVSNPEAFQMLRTRLRYFNVDRQIRSVLVTSSSPGDGKTTIAWNLAASAASAGIKAILIEADFHQPRVAERTGAAPLPGLSELLSEQSSQERTIQKSPVESGSNGTSQVRTVDLIVAGSHPPNAAELLESAHMRELVERLTEEYELVVIDTPPVSRLADAIPLIRLVDGVIVVGRVGKTTRDEANNLDDQLRSLDAPTLGIVANRAPERGRYSGYGYYGRYGYGYGSKRQGEERPVGRPD